MKNWLIKLFTKKKVRTYKPDPMDHISIGLESIRLKLKRINEGQKVDNSGFLVQKNNLKK